MADVSQDPFGMAVQKQYHSATPVFMKVSIKDVVTRDIDIALFFETPDEFLRIDRIALAHCRGHILDVGAGSGRFALPLQQEGLEVVAVERLPQLAAIMKARGVKDVRCMELDTFLAAAPQEKFDTVLMMMNGLGILGTLARLENFLQQIKPFMRSGGQILADSMDVRMSIGDDYSRHIAAQEKLGGYFGEIQMKFEFEGVTGADFPWLHMDAATLTEIASRQGWTAEILYSSKDGTYLARLTQH